MLPHHKTQLKRVLLFTAVYKRIVGARWKDIIDNESRAKMRPSTSVSHSVGSIIAFSVAFLLPGLVLVCTLVAECPPKQDISPPQSFDLGPHPNPYLKTGLLSLQQYLLPLLKASTWFAWFGTMQIRGAAFSKTKAIAPSSALGVVRISPESGS